MIATLVIVYRGRNVEKTTSTIGNTAMETLTTSEEPSTTTVKSSTTSGEPSTTTKDPCMYIPI